MRTCWDLGVRLSGPGGGVGVLNGVVDRFKNWPGPVRMVPSSRSPKILPAEEQTGVSGWRGPSSVT